MWVYGIEEYNKKECASMNYDRIIMFNLLRSNVWVMIKDNNIYVSQEVHCNEFYSDIITQKEKEAAEYEKSSIEFWANKNKQLLIDNIPTRKIIRECTKNWDDTLIIRKEKLAVSKIEYARDKVKEEYRERKQRILDFTSIFKDNYTRDYVERMLGINDFPRGEQTIRFHMQLVKDGERYVPLGIGIDGKRIESNVDIHIGSKSIEQLNGGTLWGEDEPIMYFCHKYFELLRKGTPINDILKLDNGEIIEYKPSIISSVKRLARSQKKSQ